MRTIQIIAHNKFVSVCRHFIFWESEVAQSVYHLLYNIIKVIYVIKLICIHGSRCVCVCAYHLLRSEISWENNVYKGIYIYIPYALLILWCV